MRWKDRPAAPELRAELAGTADMMVRAAQGVDPRTAAAFRARAAAIRAGAEVRLAGWEAPSWARGRFGHDDRLILGTDDILRLDPAFHSG